MSSEQIREVLPIVLDTGYRHIDTAYSYGNEAAIGDVLNDYFTQGKLKRDDVFVATKVCFFLGCFSPRPKELVVHLQCVQTVRNKTLKKKKSDRGDFFNFILFLDIC